MYACMNVFYMYVCLYVYMYVCVYVFLMIPSYTLPSHPCPIQLSTHTNPSTLQSPSTTSKFNCQLHCPAPYTINILFSSPIYIPILYSHPVLLLQAPSAHITPTTVSIISNHTHTFSLLPPQSLLTHPLLHPKPAYIPDPYPNMPPPAPYQLVHSNSIPSTPYSYPLSSPTPQIPRLNPTPHPLSNMPSTPTPLSLPH